MNKSESKKILAWSLHLGDYSFVIEHIPGKDNVVVDALSRLENTAIHGCFVKEFTTSNFFKEATDLFGNEDDVPLKDDEGSVGDEEGSIGVTVSEKKTQKSEFC